MSMDAGAALLLRDFVRLGIAAECEGVADLIQKALSARHERYLLDLRELGRRKSQKHHQFLTDAQYRTAAERLHSNFERDKLAIQCDPEQPHFQRWRASDVDFKKLVIRQMLEQNPECFGVEQDLSRTGDDHWYFDIVVGNCLSAVGGNVSAAARAAAKYINEQIEDGGFVRQSAESPREPVEAENLRQVYVTKRSDRRKAYAKMLPDTFAAFYSWARSDQCKVAGPIVSSLLPSDDVCLSWSEDERTAWGRVHRYHDLVAAWLPEEDAQKEYLAQAQALITAFWQFRHANNKRLHETEIVADPPSWLRRGLSRLEGLSRAEQAANSISEQPGLSENGLALPYLFLQLESGN